MALTSKTVNEAIRDARSGFPFPQIFDDTADTIRVLASVLQKLAPTGSRLLDIGCGALDKAAVFQQLGYMCFGCDDFQDPWHRNQGNLDPVLAFAKEADIQVYVQKEDHTVPWERESFDVVTLIDVLEHLHESPREILNFAGSCLKSNGLLIVVMPNSVNLRKRLSVALGRSNYTPARGFYESVGPWRGHVREYTFGETCQVVQWSGFDVVLQRTFHGLLKGRLSSPLLRFVFRALCIAVPGFRDSLLVVARKPSDWEPREPEPEAMQKSLTDSWLVVER